MPERKNILLTTSRRPTNRIRSFCRELAGSLPDIVRINRGKLNLDGIVEKALEVDADRVVVVDRWKGGPGKIQFFLVKEITLTPVPPIIYVRGIKLRREFEIKTRPTRSFVITTSAENSFHVEKVAEFLARFFNISMLPIQQAASRYSASMHISTNALSRTIITFVLLPEFKEIGPRISAARLGYFE